MSKKAELGVKGETLAVKHLEDKGYKILVRNYRYKHAEIDIIAQLKNLLIFIEVKARSKTKFGFPEEFVDDKKVAKVLEGAEQYMSETDWKGDVRFDIISVIDNEETYIKHFEDAFY